MPQKNVSSYEHWDAIYQSERHRIPVRQLCPGIDRHFQWEAADEQHKVPIAWLTHYASCFHFNDSELWAARTQTDMPAASGVYFLFDGEQCIYVGESYCLRDRAIQHKRNRVRWTSHTYFEVPKFFSPAVEAYYIRRIDPVLNASFPKHSAYSEIVEKLGLDREAKLVSPASPRPT